MPNPPTEDDGIIIYYIYNFKLFYILNQMHPTNKSEIVEMHHLENNQLSP